MSNVEFGITLKANGQGEFVGTVSAAEMSMQRLGATASGAGSSINAGTERGREGIAKITADADKLSATIAKVGHYAAAYLGVSQFVQYGQAVIETQTAMDRFNSSIAIATGSAQNAAGEFDHVRQLSGKLGLELLTTANAYASFSAAARGTSLEGQKARDVFDSVAGVTAKMGLNGEQSQGVFLALSQMMSKGVVSAEEFRQQLGERLPIATEAGARAMQVSTAEFTNMLNSGKLLSEEFLPKFAQALTEMGGGSGPVDTLQASLNRLKNNFTEVQLVVADSAPLKSGADALVSLTSHTQLLSAAFVSLGVAGATFGALKIGSIAKDHALGILAQRAALVEQRAATLASAEAARVAAAAELERTAAMARSAASSTILTGATTASRAATLAHTEATAAHTAALAAETVAKNAASASTGIASGALAMLGGPIGWITLALGVGAAAWALWGNSAAEATKKAAAEMDANIEQIKAKATKQGLSARDGLTSSLGDAKQSRDQANAAYQQDPQNMALRDKAIKAAEYAARIKQELADLDTYERNLANKPVDRAAWDKLHQTDKQKHAQALDELNAAYLKQINVQNLSQEQMLKLAAEYEAKKAVILASGAKNSKATAAQDPLLSDVTRAQMDSVKLQLQASGMSAASAADQVHVYEAALKGTAAVEKLRAEGHVAQALALQAKNEKELQLLQQTAATTIAARESLAAQQAETKATEEATRWIDKMNQSAAQAVADQRFQNDLIGKSTVEVARLTAERRAQLAVETQIAALREKYKDNPAAANAGVAKLEAQKPTLAAAAGQTAAQGATTQMVNQVAQAGGAGEQARYAKELEAQKAFFAAGKSSKEEHARAMEAIETRHQDAMLQLVVSGRGGAAAFDALTWDRQVGFVASSMEKMTQVGATRSRAMFEANKIAAKGNALVSTYQGAAKALEMGPILGPLMALGVIANGMSMIAQINSAQFGGGSPTAASVGAAGGIPSQMPNAALPVSAQATATPVAPPLQPVNVYIQGNVMTADFVANSVIPEIKNQITNADVTIIDPRSRQAQMLAVPA